MNCILGDSRKNEKEGRNGVSKSPSTNFYHNSKQAFANYAFVFILPLLFI